MQKKTNYMTNNDIRGKMALLIAVTRKSPTA